MNELSRIKLNYDHAKDKIESFSEFVNISAQTAKQIKSCNTEIDERLIRIVLILGSAFMTFNYPEVIDKGGMKTIQYSLERMIHIDKCPIS